MSRYVLCVGCCLVLGGHAAAQLRGESLPVERVPPTVTAAAERAAPGVTWKVAFRFEPKGQKEWYRLGGHDRKNRFVMTMRVEADGKLEFFQTELSAADTPKAVTAALKDKFPGFASKRVDGLSKDAENFFAYRFEGKTAEGKAEVVLVSTDGKRAMTEAEAAKPGPAK